MRDFGRSVTPGISFALREKQWRMRTRFSPQSPSILFYVYYRLFILFCKELFCF